MGVYPEQAHQTHSEDMAACYLVWTVGGVCDRPSSYIQCLPPYFIALAIVLKTFLTCLPHLVVVRKKLPLSDQANATVFPKGGLGSVVWAQSSHPDPFPIHIVFQFWLSDNYWLQANLYLGLQDLDCEDPRSYCFSVLASHGKSHIFSVELGNELAVWEKAFQRATFMEVQRTGVSGTPTFFIISFWVISGT